MCGKGHGLGCEEARVGALAVSGLRQVKFRLWVLSSSSAGGRWESQLLWNAKWEGSSQPLGIFRKVSDSYYSRNSWRAGKGRVTRKGTLEDNKAGARALEDESQGTWILVLALLLAGVWLACSRAWLSPLCEVTGLRPILVTNSVNMLSILQEKGACCNFTWFLQGPFAIQGTRQNVDFLIF